MKRKAHLFIIILSALLGAFFIFSAWSKTVPNTAYFEQTIQSQIGVSHALAAFAARFFIGLEAALGIMLLINVYGFRKWVLKASLALLVIFSIHLVILWINMGSDVDCGCMGSLVKMNPWVSLIKNIVLIGLLMFVHRFAPPEQNKLNNILSIVVTLILVCIPFFIFPMQPVTVSLSKFYQNTETDRPHKELRKGKNVLCLMSLTCPHCRHAATLISEIDKNHPGLPFYIVFPDEHQDSLQTVLLQDFMNETHADHIPHSFIPLDDFVELVHSVGEDGVPTMLWLEDTTVVRMMEVPDLEDTAAITKQISTWVK